MNNTDRIEYIPVETPTQEYYPAPIKKRIWPKFVLAFGLTAAAVVAIALTIVFLAKKSSSATNNSSSSSSSNTTPNLPNNLAVVQFICQGGDINNSTLDHNGSNAIILTANSNPATIDQKWRLTKLDSIDSNSAIYHILNLDTELALASGIQSGTIVTPDTSSIYQKWIIRFLPDETENFSGIGVYGVQSVYDNDQVLTYTPSISSNFVDISALNPSDFSSINQQWIIRVAS